MRNFAACNTSKQETLHVVNIINLSTAHTRDHMIILYSDCIHTLCRYIALHTYSIIAYNDELHIVCIICNYIARLRYVAIFNKCCS